jgi:hypothetical protein
MNIQEPMSPMTCERMELLLPLLDDGDLDPSLSRAAAEHLLTCAHCQHERERYRALDVALRERFGLASVRSYTTEEIMQRITDRAEHADEHERETRDTPVRLPRRPRGAKAWLSGLGAVAVVAVLLGLATTLFGGRLGFGPGASGGPPQPSFAAGTQGVIADVSMVSPTEGWALAKVTKSPGIEVSTTAIVTFYHFKNGVWTPSLLHLSNEAAAKLAQQGDSGGFNGTISMDSATDGWAMARNYNAESVFFQFANGEWLEAQGPPSTHLAGIQAVSAHSVWTFEDSASGASAAMYRFDGTSWIRQTINADMTAHPMILALQMASAGQGWALMKPSQDYGDPHYTILRYAGNDTWTVHSTLNAGNLGEVSGLAMVSADEGWAIGSRAIDGPSSVTAGKPVPQALFHYHNGKWETAPITFSESGAFITLQKILMPSAQSGWIIGQVQNQRPGITAAGIQKHTLLLHYDGNAWSEVATPNVGGDASAINGMAFAGDTAWAGGYVAALPVDKSIQDSDVPSYGSPMLWRYTNGGWTLYQQR